MFALVDCNNFYTSCERLFRPDLRNKPIIVLSNNDGCVVARSAEAKALGIKMGVPVYQVQNLVKRYQVQVFSSNYELYGDISSRVMYTLANIVPDIEVYSIDEAFLYLGGYAAHDLSKIGQKIRSTIKQHIGIPVCVGIAPSKTLAKLANHAAKQYPATGGVVDLSDPARQRRLLKIMPVSEVWGVGKKLTVKLNALGITTALDLAMQDKQYIRKRFSLVLERIVRELNGESCLALGEIPQAKQQIICSRSFADRVTTHTRLQQLVSGYISKAAEKLRKEQQYCRHITVFIRTGMFNTTEKQYRNSASILLPYATDDTRDLLQTGIKLLDSIWRDGYRYAKAGVILNEFTPVKAYQPDLFINSKSVAKNKALMQVIDSLNQKASNQVYFASQFNSNPFVMKQDRVSPKYTTKWRDLLLV